MIPLETENECVDRLTKGKITTLPKTENSEINVPQIIICNKRELYFMIHNLKLFYTIHKFGCIYIYKIYDKKIFYEFQLPVKRNTAAKNVVMKQTWAIIDCYSL